MRIDRFGLNAKFKLTLNIYSSRQLRLTWAACSSGDENMGANDGPVVAQITAGIKTYRYRLENNGIIGY